MDTKPESVCRASSPRSQASQRQRTSSAPHFQFADFLQILLCQSHMQDQSLCHAYIPQSHGHNRLCCGTKNLSYGTPLSCHYFLRSFDADAYNFIGDDEKFPARTLFAYPLIFPYHKRISLGTQCNSPCLIKIAFWKYILPSICQNHFDVKITHFGVIIYGL